MPKNILELYEALHMIFLQLLSFQWRGNHNYTRLTLRSTIDLSIPYTDNSYLSYRFPLLLEDYTV